MRAKTKRVCMDIKAGKARRMPESFVRAYLITLWVVWFIIGIPKYSLL